MPLSLKARVGLFALLFPFFLLATGWVLYFANQKSLERVHLERLSATVYHLLAMAESNNDGLWLPKTLADERFNQVQSGLIALVRYPEGAALWTSVSALGSDIESLRPLRSDQPGVMKTGWTEDRAFLQAGMSAKFSELPDAPIYQFEVLQKSQLIREEARAFTTTLTLGLVIVAGLMLVFLIVLAYCLLRPLQSVSAELGRIEKGEQSVVSEVYPREISLLTRALNQVIDAERKQRERYRHSLGDLAHSLKTPLAIMRGELDQLSNADTTATTSLQQQLSHLNQVVTYQLKRASSAGERLWLQPTAVEPIVQRVSNALSKLLHHSKAIKYQVSVAGNVGFLGDESDFMEIAGNLIENAFKYAETKVRVSAGMMADGLEFIVADDGPGIPSAHWMQAQQRGIRLDSRTTGQGIGLAVVAELVSSYQGEITLLSSSSAWPGANIKVKLPAKAMPQAATAGQTEEH